jgi:hypothetical protein
LRALGKRLCAAAPRRYESDSGQGCGIQGADEMPKYVLKFLLDLDAPDDLAARRRAAELVVQAGVGLAGAREIVLHSVSDHKSIRLNSDGSFQGQWNRGGLSAPPGEVKSGGG